MRTTIHLNEFEYEPEKKTLWRDDSWSGLWMSVRVIYEKGPWLVFADEEDEVWICTKFNGISKILKKKWGVARRGYLTDFLYEAIFNKDSFNEWIRSPETDLVRKAIIEWNGKQNENHL